MDTSKLKSFGRIVGSWILVLGLVLGGAYLLYWAAGEFAEWFGKRDTIIQAAFIAVGGAVLTAITALFVKRIENKHAVDAQFRKDKADLFLEFMKAFDDLGSANITNRRLLKLLKDFQRKMVIWCDVDTMKVFIEMRRLASAGEDGTVGWLASNVKL